MKRIMVIVALMALTCMSVADQLVPWAAPSAVTQVAATAVTGTTMFAGNSIDPWSNTGLFSTSFKSSARIGWQAVYPVRCIINNPSGYTLQVWIQSNTPTSNVYGVLVPAGSSWIWPSPMPYPSQIFASTTNTASVAYGLSLWR